MELEGAWAHLSEAEQDVTGYETPFPVKFISIEALRGVSNDMFEDVMDAQDRLATDPESFSESAIEQLAEDMMLMSEAPSLVNGMEIDLFARYATTDMGELAEVAARLEA